MKFVQIQPKEWFEKNAFEDEDGDYWETEKAYLKYKKELNKDLGESGSTARLHELSTYFCLDNTNLNDLDDWYGIVDVTNEPKENYEWGIKKRLPKSKYPEYYL